MFRKLFNIANFLLIASWSIFVTMGCENKDDGKEEEEKPRIVTAFTEGMYILCQGDQASSTDGCITRINPQDWSVSQIKIPNLVGTPRDIVVSDDYLIVNITDANQIEIIDKLSMKSVKSINTRELWGEKGIGPRRLFFNDVSLYVSFDAGYVGKLNVKTFSTEGIEKAGSYPEGMVIGRGYSGLIVACSDRGKGNASIDFIGGKDPLKKVTSGLLICPTDIFRVGGNTLCLDKGTIDENGNQVLAGIRRISEPDVVNLIDATLCAKDNGNLLYVVNAPKTNPATPVTFGYYIPGEETSGMFSADALDNPSAMGVDYLNGHIYVACKGKDSNSGYVNIYSPDGQFVKKVETGKNPIAIVMGWDAK